MGFAVVGPLSGSSELSSNTDQKLWCRCESPAPTERQVFYSNKRGGVRTSTPPNIKNGSTQAAVLRALDLTVFLSHFAANSFATAFWTFSVSTRWRLVASMRTSSLLAVNR